MADDLADIMERFDLNRKEKEGFEVAVEEIDEGMKVCKLSILGKIMGEKITNYNGVRNFVINAWGCSKNLRVAELGANLYQFVFGNTAELERVINKGPWIIDNQIMVLRKWNAGLEDRSEKFSTVHLWMQAWNIPLQCFTKEVGRKIGRAFEKISDVIIPQSGSKEGRHMKLLVVVNPRQPLLRGITMKINGASRWIVFRYERCPEFCFNCGIVGHGERTCIKRNNPGDKSQRQQFGAWMRAKGGKSSLITSKASTNHDYFKQISESSNKHKDEQGIQKSNGKEKVAGVDSLIVEGTSQCFQVAGCRFDGLEVKLKKISKKKVELDENRSTSMLILNKESKVDQNINCGDNTGLNEVGPMNGVVEVSDSFDNSGSKKENVGNTVLESIGPVLSRGQKATTWK